VLVGGARRGLIALAVVVVLVAGTVTAWLVLGGSGASAPGCTVTVSGTAAAGAAGEVVLSLEQADNAATIAGVGTRLGMPAHAVTVALATAWQESGLRNLPGGDRDSAGLFQQRPSQGWGSYTEILDPVYAATAFYRRLNAQQGWTELSVTEAAQRVQRSALPLAYARWESRARTAAVALTGQVGAGLTCHDLTVSAPSADLVATAGRELGTAALSGAHSSARGWSIGTWLVAHASLFGIDEVTFDGRTWTAASGGWAQTGAADGVLSLHQVPAAPPSP
jgi:hypothetical protein